MSTTIDHRVVEMEFDNKQFERNVSDTMSSIEKLKEKLSLKGLGKAAENEFTAYKAGYSGLVQFMKDATNRMWSSLERDVGMRMKSILKSLSVEPITTGFKEYETQMGAIQTILANTESKGSTLDDVNKALDELNTYADKTIYNFTEMTKNIGTFTAAGVDLDTSVSAIKGIANLAAVSGSTSQQASTAMYQLSQAMASGTVKLMDWNSVVNAGMGGQVFQDALKETARAHGVAVDDIIKKHGSFRESLTEGWITTEILTDTLTHFTMAAEEGSKEWNEYKKSLMDDGYTEKQAESILKLANTATGAATEVKTFTQLWDTLKESAQSGWSQTWEILVGDFEEAKELLTNISDVIGGIIGDSAEARNELLENWKVLGGRKDLIDSFANIWKALIAVIKPISEAFGEIFPPMTAEKLFAFTEGLKNFTEKLIISDETADKLKRTFKGVFAVLDIVKMLVSAILKPIGSLLGGVGDLGGGVLNLTASLGDLLVAFRDFIEYSDIFNTVFEGIANVIKFVMKIISTLFNFIAGGFASSAISSFVDFLSDVELSMVGVGSSAGGMKDAFVTAIGNMRDALAKSKMFQVFSSICNAITTVASAIFKFGKTLVVGFIDKLANADFQTAIDILSGLLSGGLAVGIGKLVFDLAGSVKKFGGILDSFSSIIESFKEQVSFGDGIVDKIFMLAGAILILTASLLILSFIDSEKLSYSIAVLTTLFADLLGSIAILNKLSGFGLAASKLGAMMIMMSVSILLLSSALKKIASIDQKEMTNGLLGVTGLLLALSYAIKFMSGSVGSIPNKTASTLIAIGLAVLILTSAIKRLSDVNWGDLGKAGAVLGGLVGAFALLALSSKLITPQKLTKIGGSLIVLSLALMLFVVSIKQLAAISWDGLARAGAAIYGLVGAFALFNLASKLIQPKSLVKKAASLMVLALALAMFVPSITALSNISWDGLARAGVAIYGLIGAFALFNLVSKMIQPASLVKKAASLMVLGLALSIFAGSITILSLISWEGLAKAGVAIYGLIGAFALLNLASKMIQPKKLLTISGSMAILGASLLIFTMALSTMLLIPWESLGKFGAVIGGLVGTFALLNLASKLIEPGKLLKISGALTILGAALLIFTMAAFNMSFIPWESLGKAGIVLLALIGVLELLSLVLKTLYPGDLVTLGLGLMTLSVGLTMLSAAIIALSLIPWITLGKSALVLLGLIGALGLLSLVLKAVYPGDLWALGLALTVLSVGMTAMGVALIVLSASNIESVLTSLVAIAGAITIFALAAKLTQPLIPAMIALAGVLVMLSSAVTLLGLGLLAIGVALPVIGAGLTAFLTALVVSIELIIKAFGTLLLGIVDTLHKLIVAVCLLIVEAAPAIGKAIVSILIAVCDVLIEALPAVSKAIIVLISELCKILVECAPIIVEAVLQLIVTLLDQLTKYVPTIVDFLFNLVLAILSGIADNIPKFIVEVINILAKLFRGILDALGSIDPSVLIDGLLAVGLMAGIIAALAAVSSMIPAAMLGVLGMGVIAVELAAVLATIGQLTKIPGLMDAIGDGGNFLQAIGTAIGQFIGGIVGGIAEGATSTLPQVGTNLSNFMTNAQPFFDGLANVNEDTINSARSLADVILTITSLGIIDALTSWISGESSIETFSSDIIVLGRGIKGFSDAVAGVSPENVTAAANAAKALAEMTDTIPKEGGVVAWFAGENSISKFAAEIPILGYAIKAFSDNVTGINPEQVTAAANAAKALAEMTEHVPKEGGIEAWFAGETSISKFAADLVLLGTAIKGFADESTGVNPESVSAAANAAKTLAEMTEHTPKENGVKAWFAGETSIANFAQNLPILGRGLKGFGTEVSGINAEQVGAAANAAKALAEMTEHVPKEGGIKAWFTGETSVSNFADKLPTLGAGIKGFSESINGISPTNVEAAANASKALAEMTNTVPKDTDKILSFGDNITKFGSKLKGYFDNSKNITEESITNSKKAVDAVQTLTTLNSDSVSSAAKAIESVTKALKNMSSIPENATSVFVTAIEKLGKTSTDALLKSFEDLGSKLKNVATKAMEEFVNGLKDKKKKSSAEEACESMVTACADAMKEKQTSFYNAGSHLVTGFANGISENSYKAAAKSKAMAEAAVEAAREALDINSPSKVFRSMGYSVPEGFAMGIDKMSGMVTNSSVSMADNAIDNVKTAISRVASAVNSDIDAQPTIRPVLDLSDVKAGAGLIGNILSGSQAVGVLTNVGAINSMMNQRNQNGANDDVVTEISKLRKDFANIERPSYNINGITITGDDEVEAAFETLLRAAKIGGRM